MWTLVQRPLQAVSDEGSIQLPLGRDIEAEGFTLLHVLLLSRLVNQLGFVEWGLLLRQLASKTSETTEPAVPVVPDGDYWSRRDQDQRRLQDIGRNISSIVVGGST